MLIDIRFATQSYQHDSAPVSSQRMINAFAEKEPPDAKYPVVVFGSPGITEFAEVGTGPIRGCFCMGDFFYVVSGTQFYSVDQDGNAVLIGAGVTGSGNICMDGDGTNVVIVNGDKGFVYNSNTTAFAQIADVNFQSAMTVTFIDERFTFDWMGTRKVFVSNLADPTTYDASGFATKESRPDRVMAVRNRQNTLLIFGEETTEVWYDNGTVPFPFAPYGGSLIDRGLAASLAMAVEDNALFFLGDDVVFYRLSGLQLQRVSTHALEHIWGAYDDITDAFCFALNDRGHKFIYLTFPTAQATFGYDIATGLWHERISDDIHGSQVRWRVTCACNNFVNGKRLVGDLNGGRIGFIDLTSTTEFGNQIITTLVSPPIHGKGARMFMSLFELDMETGVGTSTGQGVDPQVMLDYSDDGGRTWSNPQRFAGMGKIGEYTTRVYWEQLGTFYQRTIRISISDPVRRTIMAARADIVQATGR